MMPIPKVAPSILFPRFSPRSFDSRIALAHKLAVESTKEDFKGKTENRLIGRFQVDVIDKQGQLLATGKSPIADLFTNNFGYILGGLLAASIANVDYTFTGCKDITNAAASFIIYYSGSGGYSLGFYNAGSGAKGLQLGVGSGVTAPARTDYNLQTILGAWTAVTNTTDLYSNSTYQVITTCSITLAAGGTVNEAGAALILSNPSGTTKTIMVAHDVISPAVGVPAGAAAIPSWTVQT